MAASGFRFKITREVNRGTIDELKQNFADNRKVVNVGLGPGTREADGTPLAMIGAAHEYGVPKLGIPERSWLRSSITGDRAQFVALNKANLVKIMQGKQTFMGALGQLGEAAKGAAQEQIGTPQLFGELVPLKPATIKRKGSDHPLIDTGNMQQSITYTIGERGEA